MRVSIGGALTDLKSLTQEKKPRVRRKTDNRTIQPQENTYSHLAHHSHPNFFKEAENPLAPDDFPIKFAENPTVQFWKIHTHRLKKSV